MSQQVVEQVKADLVNRGFQFQTNCDAWQITARVAFKVGGKLVQKSEAENHCLFNGQRYGIDVVVMPDGWFDCLGSAGPPANANRPQWSRVNPSGATLLDPPNLDAIIEPPPPDPVPADWLGAFALELMDAAAGLRQTAGNLEAAANIAVEASKAK